MKEEMSSKDLNELLGKDDFFLFDIRNTEEFEKGHIEGKSVIPTLNIPYFDLIEKGGKDNYKESIIYYVKTQLADQLPKNKKIFVVCAKGGTSATLANILRDLEYQATSLAGGMKSWGNFYDRKTIVSSPDLLIYQVIRVSRGCLSYVIISDGMGAVIDPLRNIQYYLDLFNELKVKPQYILDTHAHADHISGGRELADKLGVPYYLHPDDAILPKEMLPAKIPYQPSCANKTYQLGKVELKALHIPGHTLGNQAFLLDNKYLFTGDSIFIRSIARSDLGGEERDWTILQYKSLRKLMELPDDILVLPAHFSSLQESNADGTFSQTLGVLKRSNEGLVLAQKSLEEFLDSMLGNLPKFPNEYFDIKKINLGLIQVDEEKASVLELGKNICAMNPLEKSGEMKK